MCRLNPVLCPLNSSLGTTLTAPMSGIICRKDLKNQS